MTFSLSVFNNLLTDLMNNHNLLYYQSMKLPRSFYNRPTLEVAPDLLGKFIVYNSPNGIISARIVEVEAYIGQDDPACHASHGLTERTKPMFGPPGFTYIYLIYGMYNCLNFVTEPEGSPAAVLLRAAELIEPAEIADGHKIISHLNNAKSAKHPLSGPGKFCRSFGLTTEQNNLDLTEDQIFVEDRGLAIKNIKQTGRIGVRVGKKRLWRFFDADSEAVSGKR